MVRYFFFVDGNNLRKIGDKHTSGGDDCSKIEEEEDAEEPKAAKPESCAHLLQGPWVFGCTFSVLSRVSRCCPSYREAVAKRYRNKERVDCPKSKGNGIEQVPLGRCLGRGNRRCDEWPNQTARGVHGVYKAQPAMRRLHRGHKAIGMGVLKCLAQAQRPERYGEQSERG